MNKFKLFFLSIIVCLAGCAGPNPNPGERTVDIAWTSGEYNKAFAEVEMHAIEGKPWAELRIAIFYEHGWGVEQSLEQAEKFYKMAISKTGEDEWSKGQMIGAMGESGYFNQNSDAIIAEYNLAQLYFTRNSSVEDLKNAHKHISNVLKKSEGNDVFFCCEFAGGRAFDQEMFQTLDNKINAKINENLESAANGGS